MSVSNLEELSDLTRPRDDVSDSGSLDSDGEAPCEPLSPSIIKRVLAFYNKGNVEAVMSLVAPSFDENGNTNKSPKDPWDPLLLWVRPGPCCIHFLAHQVREAEISSIASVGCGTGLLEWMIQTKTGLSVMGYEINGSWWCSKYAPPTFIPLTYVDPEEDPPAAPCTHALMCCYFNNAPVFRKYVDAYEGPLLIIIGSTHKARCTEPRPYDYIDVHPWTLTSTHNITDVDVIACYIRDPWKVDVANKLRIFTRVKK
ncbi:uncharacterized protein [Macrobrachium rosenbergii]|uniref:uncharacterized protein n=1 Tax=Macrobrachium rosenbergii TaxID=79674 RepID=UPI0034D52E15